MNTVLTLQLATEVRRNYMAYNISKRSLDLVLATIALILVSPLMFLIAIAIKVDSRGPVFFMQKRYGFKGKIFKVYKFRTMYMDDCKDRVSPKNIYDKRITPMGRIVRKHFLDELPQIFNIINGDMSLVGPRPEQKFLVNMHRGIYRKRFKVKPGLTGLWQISGKKNPIYKYIKYDLKYIRNRSFWLDLKILLLTIPVFVKGEK